MLWRKPETKDWWGGYPPIRTTSCVFKQQHHCTRSHHAEGLTAPHRSAAELQGHSVALYADLHRALRTVVFPLLGEAAFVLLQEADAFFIAALQRTNHSAASDITSSLQRHRSPPTRRRNNEIKTIKPVSLSLFSPCWTPPPRSTLAEPRSLCWTASGLGLWHRNRGHRVSGLCRRGGQNVSSEVHYVWILALLGF